MGKKFLFGSMVLLTILCSGCALKKDQGSAKIENTEKTENFGSTVSRQQNNEFTNKEIFKGKVDKSNLFQIYEFQYSNEQAGDSIGIYVNMPCCFTGKKMLEWEATYEREGSPESGCNFFADNEKNATISVWTSTNNDTPPVKNYFTKYGQKISFDGTKSNLMDGYVDENGQYTFDCYMKGIRYQLWRIRVSAPKDWFESNRMLILQFLESIVALDENGNVIVQDQ